MNEGRKSQDVQSVAFFHRPLDLRIVREWVSNCPKKADEKVNEAALFPSIGIVLQAIDGEHRWTPIFRNAEGSLSKLCTVGLQAGEAAYLCGDALDGFQDRMEVVLLQKFRPAVVQDVSVDASAHQSRMQATGSREGVVKVRSPRRPSNPPVVSNVHPAKRENCRADA